MSGEQKVSATNDVSCADVQQLVPEFVSSGMQRSEFCRNRGLSFGTLNRHLGKQRRKRKSRAASAAHRLLPVELTAKKSSTQQEASWGLAAVLPGGRRIEVQRDFDANIFKRLVSALGRT